MPRPPAKKSPKKISEIEKNFKEKVRLPGDHDRRQMATWRRELAEAFEQIGRDRDTTAMKRIATLFFDDDAAAVQILGFMLPKLKAIEAKVDQESPYRLIIDLSPDRKDKEDGKESQAES